jgi:Kdo2-lipid IVA lauroyltransferase/acyltransferase
MSRGSQTRRAWEDRAASLMAGLVRRLPRWLALALGRGLGRMLGDGDRRHVDIAVDNLRRALPHWEQARALRTARAVYAHFGQVLLDIFWLSGRSRQQILDRLVVEGAQNVQAAMARGRGAVLVTGHLGSWELHGIAHGLLFGPIGVVARPLDNPALDRRLCDFRTAFGNVVISKYRALAQILRLLREGRGIAVLIDQNVQAGDGVFVDFFGRKAAATTVAAALAVKTGCALVPCRTELLADGRYRLVYEPPLTWSASGDRQADIHRLTQALTWRIEAWVRDTPEQWLWIHRRWKTQPAAADLSLPSPSAIDDPAEVAVLPAIGP